MNNRIVILGSGESGTGAALLAKRQGFDVFVSDRGTIKETYKNQLDAQGIGWEEGQHSLDKILNANEIIKSPGIPEKNEVMQAIRAKGINVIGEIEFGWRYAGKCKIVAITGSNGKTTTTELVYHLLKTADLDVRKGGNVGNSFATMIYEDLVEGNTEKEDRVFVLEVSSFQLDDIQQFRPDIAILLNITPDHLDRYDYNMDNYVQSKFRIALNQENGDLFIINQDDENIVRFLKEHPETVKCKIERVRKSDFRSGYVCIGHSYAFDLANTELRGQHNMFNAACAIRVALKFGIESELIEESLYYFAPPPHRLEKVAIVHGVTYINDSKATNVDSTYYALQAMDTPTVWIVGGQDKGNDYSVLFSEVKKKVKAIVCLGVDNSKIISAFSQFKKPMVEVSSAEEAVKAASGFTEEGDTVLLSPACASFDLFKNYEDRGGQFKQAVLSMKNGE